MRYCAALYLSLLTLLVNVCMFNGVQAQEDLVKKDYTPGWHKGIKVPKSERVKAGIDLYLPKSYGSDPDRVYPALILSWPNGEPPTKSLVDWAEKQQFILLGLNGSRNGEYEPNKVIQARANEIMDQLQCSQVLRFGIGFSGGAQSNWGYATSWPQHCAGLLMIGQSGWPDLMTAPHVNIAYMYGSKEGNKKWIKAMIPVLEKQGTRVKEYEFEGGHKPGKPNEWEPLLDWIYYQALFNHPNLSDAEKKFGDLLIEERIEKIDQLPDDQKVVEVESLLSIERVARRKEVNDLVSQWYGLRLTQAKEAQKTDAIEAYYQLDELLNHPLAKHRGVDRELSKEAKTLSRTISRDKAVKKEITAKRKLDTVQKMASRIPSHAPQSKWKQVREAYEHIAKQYSGTRAAKIASERAAKLAGE